jgi:glycosyltransferase involved in cell wall biosynthesis
MDKVALHILLVTSWYPSEAQPTYGSFVEEQAQLLRRKGHRVSVLHIALSGTFVQSLGSKTTVREEKYGGIDVRRITLPPVLPGMRSLNYRKAQKYALREARKLFSSAKPDVIHSHSLFLGGVVAFYLGKHMEVPFVHTEHSSALIFSPQDYTRTDIRMLRKVYAAAQKVLCVSHFLRDEVQRMYAPKGSFQVLPNMVDTAFFELQRAEPNPEIKLLSIGSLIPVKNYSLLLDAMQIVCANRPDVTLAIHGDGEERVALEARCLELGLQAKVKILPRLTRRDVIEAMQNASMLVSSSRVETFGLTVAEALASGMPVVATDSGGVRDILSEEVGILCPAEANTLAEAILEGILRREGYSSKTLRAFAKSRFHEDIIYNELLSLYRQR